MRKNHPDFPHIHANPVLRQMIALFGQLFGNETKPTRKRLILFTLGTFYLNCCPSVRNMFDNFLCYQSDGLLSSFYYTLNEGKLFSDLWSIILLDIVLSKVNVLKDAIITLIVDDTLVEKFGEHFELVGRLFDHCAKNGSNYLNGHCFVTIIVCIPILYNGEVKLIHFPLRHKLWDKESGDSKLKIASEMIETVYLHLRDRFKMNVCCDSWYPKGEMVELHTKYNIPFICAVRSDTALYEMPIENQPGKRGPKPIRGKKLGKDLNDVFDFTAVDGYKFLIAHKRVVTKIFGRTPCTVYATKPKNGGKINIFLATDCQDLSNFNTELIKNDQMKALLAADTAAYLPFAIYKNRWQIEISYYELKKFWGFCDYKLRSYCGIQNLINLQTLIYAVTSVLPYLFEEFECIASYSIQERRAKIGDLVRRLLNYERFASDLESTPNSHGMVATCEHYMAHLSLVG